MPDLSGLYDLDAVEPGSRGEEKKGHPMSTNAHNFPAQFPLTVGSATPVRGGGVRGKFGPASVTRPSSALAPEVPKVGLSEICLSYRTQRGERLLALDHINLEVKAGEFLCIVGPSGCGKSTLLHLIAGLHQQTSGQILVDGKPVQGTGTDRILIFQELGLFPWLTVGENVEFGMKMKGIEQSRKGREDAFLSAPGSPGAIQGQLHASVVRGHAAARGLSPSPGHRARCLADG